MKGEPAVITVVPLKMSLPTKLIKRALNNPQLQLSQQHTTPKMAELVCGPSAEPLQMSTLHKLDNIFAAFLSHVAEKQKGPSTPPSYHSVAVMPMGDLAGLSTPDATGLQDSATHHAKSATWMVEFLLQLPRWRAERNSSHGIMTLPPTCFFSAHTVDRTSWCDSSTHLTDYRCGYSLGGLCYQVPAAPQNGYRLASGSNGGLLVVISCLQWGLLFVILYEH
ncbi:Hypothetical predicted protein [Pelobates cultripes]|uniref:Uncharacterized protein n=1 Tax=Pelobates cultripes TaxID=61616 RepID=A0AAD1RW48_PELCU|nr:Hypothetical predicted protein [Pelobates cultripes]